MRLIFVYNANSGAKNAVLDSLHKIVSPKTYDCKLCELTFGVVGEKQAWKRFRQRTEIEMDFLHKDEFLKQYRSKWLPKYEFPVVLVDEGNGLEIFVLREDFNDLKNTSDLMDLINQRLSPR